MRVSFSYRNKHEDLKMENVINENNRINGVINNNELTIQGPINSIEEAFRLAHFYASSKGISLHYFDHVDVVSFDQELFVNIK